jgi:hypothetical protein
MLTAFARRFRVSRWDPGRACARPLQVSDLADALELTALGCNATVLEARLRQAPAPLPRLAASAAYEIFVDYAAGSDSAPGTQAAPLKTIAAAVALSRSVRTKGVVATVVLRAGTHYLNATVDLNAGDSGLAFVAFPGEAPVVAGGALLSGLQWSLFKQVNATWGPVLNDTNAVYGTGCTCLPGAGPVVRACMRPLGKPGAAGVRVRAPQNAWTPAQCRRCSLAHHHIVQARTTKACCPPGRRARPRALATPHAR